MFDPKEYKSFKVRWEEATYDEDPSFRKEDLYKADKARADLDYVDKCNKKTADVRRKKQADFAQQRSLNPNIRPPPGLFDNAKCSVPPPSCPPPTRDVPSSSSSTIPMSTAILAQAICCSEGLWDPDSYRNIYISPFPVKISRHHHHFCCCLLLAGKAILVRLPKTACPQNCAHHGCRKGLSGFGHSGHRCLSPLPGRGDSWRQCAAQP